MTIPTAVAPEEARKDYIARVYKMSHAELFQELMRVHAEAAKLIEQSVKDARESCAELCETECAQNDGITCAEEIRSRWQ